MFTVVTIPMTSYHGTIILGAASDFSVGQSNTVKSLFDLPLKQDDRVLLHSDRIMVVIRKERIFLPGIRAHAMHPDSLRHAIPREDDRVKVAHTINTLTESSFTTLPCAGITVSTIQFTINAAGRVLLVKNQNGSIYTNELIIDHGTHPPAVGQSIIWNSKSHRVVMSPVSYSADLSDALVDIEALLDEHFSGITTNIDLYYELFPAVRRRIACFNRKSLNKPRWTSTDDVVTKVSGFETAYLMLTFLNGRVYAVIPAMGDTHFGRRGARAAMEDMAFRIKIDDESQVIYQFVNPSIDLAGILMDVQSEEFIGRPVLARGFKAVCDVVGGIDTIKDLAERSFNTADDRWLRND